MRKLAIYAFVLGLVLWAGAIAGILSSADVYVGTITQEPKITAAGEREISLLATGAETADTIQVKDFCLLPFTDLCRFNSADVHGTFQKGNTYCMLAYGVRFGPFSWKPNLLTIIHPHEDDYTDCIAAQKANEETSSS